MADCLTKPDIELISASSNDDAVNFLQVSNSNFQEVANYINDLLECIRELQSVEEGGVTANQVKTLIEESKIEIEIPVSWPTSTLPIDGNDPANGTLTRTDNPDGSVTVVITNLKNDNKILTRLTSYSGENVSANIKVEQSFITVTFNRSEELDITAGNPTPSTDPNIKKLYIF